MYVLSSRKASFPVLGWRRSSLFNIIPVHELAALLGFVSYTHVTIRLEKLNFPFEIEYQVV